MPIHSLCFFDVILQPESVLLEKAVRYFNGKKRVVFDFSRRTYRKTVVAVISFAGYFISFGNAHFSGPRFRIFLPLFERLGRTRLDAFITRITRMITLQSPISLQGRIRQNHSYAHAITQDRIQDQSGTPVNTESCFKGGKLIL